MTGFGKAEVQFASKKFIAEVRSLNGKQLDLSVKLPQAYKEAEMELRSLVSRKLVRGKVDLFISYEESDDGSVVPINRKVFDGYYKQLDELAQTYGINLHQEQLLQTIIRLPDVLKAERKEVTADELEAVGRVAEMALDNLVEFRIREGKALAGDILSRVDRIESLLLEVPPFEKLRIDRVKKRLIDGLNELSNEISVDRNRFEQEIIYYLEKLDITEEKVRLKNHCTYFRETALLDEPVGRKLGFIAQEMGREINTLGSKANNPDIQRLVVRMKDELEKIKEQTLNVL